MNPTTNVMSQDPGSLAQQQPKRLRGSSERIFTAVIQLVCGFIAVVCGVVLVISRPSKYGYYGTYTFERLENTAFGIWGGLVFIATATPYFFGRDKKPMVGLYFGFSLASAVIAFVGLGLSVTAINRIVNTRSGSMCYDLDSNFRYENQCCFERYYNCPNGYSYYNNYYWDRYPTKNPLLDYDSPECKVQRQLARARIMECFEESEGLFVPHLVFHGILIAVVSVELFASVYGACATLSALCNCKSCIGGQPTSGGEGATGVEDTPYYTCSFNQLMINDELNNTVPLPVTVQPPGPAIIAATQVPQVSPQPQLSTQQPLNHSQDNFYEVPNA